MGDSPSPPRKAVLLAPESYGSPSRAAAGESKPMPKSPGEATRLQILQSKWYGVDYTCWDKLMQATHRIRMLVMTPGSIMGRAAAQNAGKSPPRHGTHYEDETATLPPTFSPEVHSPKAAATLRIASSPEHILGCVSTRGTDYCGGEALSF